MTEDQMKVGRGKAQMRVPSGTHIVDYLVRNPCFPGIGRESARLLWETFGESLFELLDSGASDRLSNVVSQNKAEVLVRGWQEDGLSQSLQWLHTHGIDVPIGRRILSYFGKDTGAKIHENPYRLLSFSASWDDVDAFARKELDVAVDDERRLSAAMEEAVYRRFSRGHTYLKNSDLIAGLRAVLKDERHQREMIDKAIEHNRNTGRLLFDPEGNAYSLGASVLENNVVECIRTRLLGRPASSDLGRLVFNYEANEVNGFALNCEQKAAVRMVAEHQFSIVTGGAGVGKTTVLKCVYSVLEAEGFTVTQLALAGKAVRRMMEATERPARTLASFINTRELDGETLTLEVPNEALVIDEASMLDLITFSNVTRLIGPNTKIVLVGDPNQLPPVGPGLILHCLVGLPGIPHVELKKVERFGGDIADLATAINEGVFPRSTEFKGATQFFEARIGQMEQIACDLYLKAPDASIVLCATSAVASAINERLQLLLTKDNKPIRLFNVEHELWEYAGLYEGDLVICTENHWKFGIQNGSLGRLIEVFDEPLLVGGDEDDEYTALGRIAWDDGVTRPLRDNLLDSLELGYALTVHKGQGSQWRHVIVCLPTTAGSHSSMIDRSMVYTAVTRAQESVAVCGEYEHLAPAIRRERAADRRQVGLRRRLIEMLGPQ